MMIINAWLFALLAICIPPLLTSAGKIDIKVHNVVTSKEDAYICSSIKLPHTIYPTGFHTHSKASIAHHILLFSCKSPNPSKGQNCQAPCFSREKILYAWARNAKPLHLPKDVSFEIGGDTEFTHLVLQVHYKNRILEPDNSGVTVFTSPHPLPNIAGVLLMAANSGTIPGQKRMVPIGIACRLSMKSPITPFAVRVHAHSLGRTNFAYWFPSDDLDEPRLVGRGSPQWPQAFYPSSLRSPMRKGDYLVGFCVYDSTKRGRTTYIGATHKDEMCNVYIMFSRRREDPELTEADETVCGNGVSISTAKFSYLLERIPHKAFDYLPTKLPSHRKTKKPATHIEKKKPASHTEKTEPASHTVKTEPASHTEKTEPASHTVKTEPVSHTVKTEAASHTEKTEPASHTVKTEPASHTVKTEPASHTEKTEPASHTEETEPASHTVKTEAASHTEETEPASDTEEKISASSTKTTPPKLVVHNMKLKVQASLGQVAGVAVDSQGRLFIFHRGDRKWDANSFDDDDRYRDADERGPIKESTVLIVDRASGTLLQSFGAGRFFMPHGISIDANDNVWLTDVALHQVFRFDKHNFSKPALTVGTRLEPGGGRHHFCKPTDVAALPDGRFFVADGYCNARIVAFSPKGRFLRAWGSGSGDLRVPHSLALLNQSLLCCADRERARVECFRPADGASLVTVKGLPAFGKQLFAICPAANFSHQGRQALFGVSFREKGAPQAFLLDLTAHSILVKWNLPPGRPHDVAAFGSDVLVAQLDEPFGVLRFRVARPPAAIVAVSSPFVTVPDLLLTVAPRNVSLVEEGPWRALKENLPFLLAIVLLVPLAVIALGAIIARLHRAHRRSRSRVYKDRERGQFKALINEDESGSEGELAMTDDSSRFKNGMPRSTPPRNA